MKLIFIYGPPAVGKLTVAEKLSEISGISLFHNHITRDLVNDIYGDELTQHYDLVTDIRELVLSYCAKHDTDIIFTYVYAGAQDDDNVRSIISSVTNNGGEVIFVELTADKKDLLKRVSEESRKRFKKLDDKEILDELTKDMSNFSITFVEKTVINTSEFTPEQSATKIKELL